MRKNLNQVKIAGKVYGFGDTNGRQALELKTTGPNSKNPGTPFIGGIIQIAVDNEGLNVIPVHFTYVTEQYASGKPNATFTALKKLLDEGKTWIAVGPDAAATVKIDASISLNDFYNANNELVSSKLIEGSFATIVNQLQPNDDKNSFKVDMIITKVTRKEADPENNVPNDTVILHGGVFNFRNAILPVDFTVKNETGMEYFESLEPSTTNPVYTKVWGSIQCLTKTNVVTEDSAFGEAAVRTYEKKVRDWTVEGASTMTYDFGSEETLTKDELTKALQDREVYLADVKKTADEYKASKAGTPAKAPAAPKASTGAFNF